MPLLLCSICTLKPAGSEKVMGLCSVSVIQKSALLFNRKKKKFPKKTPQSKIQSFSLLTAVLRSSVGERHFPNEHFSVWPFCCPFWWVIAVFVIFIWESFAGIVIETIAPCGRHGSIQHDPSSLLSPNYYFCYPPPTHTPYSAVHLSEELSRENLQWRKKRHTDCKKYSSKVWAGEGGW